MPSITPNYNQMVADCFRDARNRVADGSQEFICNALDKGNRPGSERAKNIIRQRLMPGSHKFDTINSWLLRNEIGTPVDRMNEDLVREFRIRWLDALIKEFSA